ncbi:hypothetical protein EJ06DRAFT_583590 [Trichodelitschia bisporula]|uniref:Uncharacterized protein n=1 Tax=Trichodelitschia bisporula TaxID=703511 RepID=A0A6G1HQN0_9PEZI|nr:hypothetical protein EJ06DRAFT_583590 [Trichodelitschia bisporula]
MANNAGHSASNVLKQGWAKIHGAGEVIRGNVNTFADDVTGTKNPQDAATTEAGVREFETGKPNPSTGISGTNPPRGPPNASHPAQAPEFSAGATTGSSGRAPDLPPRQAAGTGPAPHLSGQAEMGQGGVTGQQTFDGTGSSGYAEQQPGMAGRKL